MSGSAEIIRSKCCIVGGGPAGMMAGLLLARAGVDVVVLEKHKDFLRDFRGDTVHPSTLQVLDELGILDDFLTRPHQKVAKLTGVVNDVHVTIADFSQLTLRCPYIVLMPQWDFLDFIAEHARLYPQFMLKMQAEVTDLIESNGVITGVKVKTPTGLLEVHSDLVIGADGRHSVTRERAGFHVKDLGAPMDVFWFRLSKRESDPDFTGGNFKTGKIMVMLNRDFYWQCAYVIPKGSAAQMQAQDIATLRTSIAGIVPFLTDRLGELASWDDVKLLTVGVDRLTQWSREGMLCIGDAAHTMSPIGGVGINIAVQDAIAAANLLAEPLLAGNVTLRHLQAVQTRRQLPMWITQRLQLTIQNKIINAVLQGKAELKLPFMFRMLKRFPFLTRFPAYLVGVGVRPEHVKK